MSSIVLLASRELKHYFRSPVGYIAVALFALLLGLTFAIGVFYPGEPASMRSVFSLGLLLLLPVCPAMSMGAIAEERRHGTFELLMTAPISELQIIAGKFVGGMGLLFMLLLPTLAHVALLEMFGRPDYGELGAGYLGMFLAGMAFLASGIFMSTLTSNQVLAFLVTFIAWLAVIVICRFAPEYVGEPWAGLLGFANPVPRLQDFSIGLVDTANIVYFAAITLGFLIGAVRSLQVSKWR